MSDSEDAEVIDLAQAVSPTPYAKLAPRDYRKLHNLHTSVQSDKTVRLPKKKPGFSYASGKEPHLPFLHQHEKFAEEFDSAGSGDDELPSPFAAASIPDQLQSEDAFESFDLQVEDPVASSFPDNSQSSLEAGMLELAEPGMVVDPAGSQVDSSFANGVFDFDTFATSAETPKKSLSPPPKKEVPKNEAASTPIVKESLKRERSATPELQDVKHRRVTKDELVSQPTQPAVPDWVNDFDPDLINELKGFVDFVD
jgi:ATP-dependent DNA helicase HFM1/MER3